MLYWTIEYYAVWKDSVKIIMSLDSRRIYQEKMELKLQESSFYGSLLTPWEGSQQCVHRVIFFF